MCVNEGEGMRVLPLHKFWDQTPVSCLCGKCFHELSQLTSLAWVFLRDRESLKAIEQGSHMEECKSSHRAPGSLSLASPGLKREHFVVQTW